MASSYLDKMPIKRKVFHHSAPHSIMHFAKPRTLQPGPRLALFPMMRQAMRHVSVRSEMMREDNCILVEDFDPFCIFDYKSATMLDV
jgi:hypothetical protein